MILSVCGFVVLALVVGAFAAEVADRRTRDETASPEAWAAGRKRIKRPVSQNFE